MQLAEVGSVMKAECGGCGGLRNCEVRGSYRHAVDEEYYQWRDYWHLLQCRGCDHVFVKKTHTNSEDYEYETGPDGQDYMVPIESHEHWPALNGRKQPDWLYSGTMESDEDVGLGLMLQEVYLGLQNGTIALAAIGIRTCFDLASEALKIKTSLPFVAKLEAMQKAGHIRATDMPRLNYLVDAGSATAHRGWRPSPRQLDDLMDILEHFIANALVEPYRRRKLDEKAEAAAAKVPKRGTRAKPVGLFPSFDADGDLQVAITEAQAVQSTEAPQEPQSVPVEEPR